MIAYARETNKGAYNDVLVLDTPPKKKALVKVITDTRKIYPWAKIIDLSTTLPDDADFVPGVRKRTTQKVKNHPLIKPVYDLLLNLYLKKQRAKEAKIIRHKLSGLGDVCQINILTQTGINETLFKLYPKAAINYFEHGLGDYIYIQKINPPNFNFYALFAHKFIEYLQNNKQENTYVKNLFNATHFPSIAKEVIDSDDTKEKINSYTKNIEGKFVLILLESVQMYQVPEAFWTDYLALCIAQIDNPHDYTFILKPHPRQTIQSIKISKEYMLNARKLKTLVIENNHAANYSAEVLYSLWQDNTDYVFSVFSSAVFYISKLYEGKKTKYYFAYDFFKKYMHNATSQFVDTYLEAEELIKEVFSENCIHISDF